MSPRFRIRACPRSKSRRLFGLALLANVCAAPAILHAQLPPVIPRVVIPVIVATPAPTPPITSVRRAVIIENDDRSGPRIGAAYLIGGSVTAEREGRSFSPLTTLFGWQLEHQFDAGPGLPTPMTELVLLAGGLEQGVVLPSASWLLGLRQRNGWEFGAGPTLTGAGVQIAIAGGVTQSIGSLNVPVNLAIAPGRRGASISITTGFNVRKN